MLNTSAISNFLSIFSKSNLYAQRQVNLFLYAMIKLLGGITPPVKKNLKMNFFAHIYTLSFHLWKFYVIFKLFSEQITKAHCSYVKIISHIHTILAVICKSLKKSGQEL